MERNRLLNTLNSLGTKKIYDLVSKFLAFVESNSNLNKEIKDKIPSFKVLLSSFEGIEYDHYELMDKTINKFEHNILIFFLDELSGRCFDDEYKFIAELILMKEREILSKQNPRIINFRLSKTYSNKLDLIEKNYPKNLLINGSELNIGMLAESENRSILPKTLLENSIDFIYYQYKNENDLTEFVDILYKDQYHPDVNDESDEYYNFLLATADKYDKHLNPPPTHEEYLNWGKEEWKERMIEKAVLRLGLNKQFILATKMFDKAYEKYKDQLEQESKKKNLGYDYDQLTKEEKLRVDLFDKQFLTKNVINQNFEESSVDEEKNLDADNSEFK